jgi:hypothetical protein
MPAAEERTELGRDLRPVRPRRGSARSRFRERAGKKLVVKQFTTRVAASAGLASHRVSNPEVEGRIELLGRVSNRP